MRIFGPPKQTETFGYPKLEKDLKMDLDCL